MPKPLKVGFACNRVITEILHNHLHRQLEHVCIQMPSNRCIGIFLTSRAWDFGPFQWEAGKLQRPAAVLGKQMAQAERLYLGGTLLQHLVQASLWAALCTWWAKLAGQKQFNFCCRRCRYPIAVIHMQGTLVALFLPHNQLAAVPKRMAPCDTQPGMSALVFWDTQMVFS